MAVPLAQAAVANAITAHQQWLQSRDRPVPEPARAIFNGKTLTADSLPEGAVLEHASFRNAQLDDVTFPRGIKLAGADFTGADLTGSNLTHVASLQAAKLNRVYGRRLCMSDVKVATNIFFRKAYLINADFRNANLTRADFSDAILRDAKFDGAILAAANLEGADFTGVLTLTLDQCNIRGTRFSPFCNEPWLKLKRTYTWFRQVQVVFFLGVFVASLFFKTVSVQISAFFQGNPNNLYGVCAIDERCTTYQVWQVLLGLAEPSWLIPLLAVVTAILNNISRVMITAEVVKQRNNEADTGISPPMKVTWGEKKAVLKRMVPELLRAQTDLERREERRPFWSVSDLTVTSKIVFALQLLSWGFIIITVVSWLGLGITVARYT